MRKARIFIDKKLAGYFEELSNGYQYAYIPNYEGRAISLTMPIKKEPYIFTSFPPFFEGLLPEGVMLEAMLKKCKLDSDDYFGQLLQVGEDLVGAVTVEEMQ